jgi:hypothetical protein
MNSTVWVVGNWESEGWSILGVFDSEEKAIAACTLPTNFLGEMKMNERLSDDITEWPGAYYPLVQSKP